MTGNEIMKDRRKSSIVTGLSISVLAALTLFILVIWLCITYNCWLPINTVPTTQDMVAASFGAFYFIEPVSYYVAFGMTGTYLGFLSENIGNMRVPRAALVFGVTHSTPGTIQAEVVSTMAICGSITTNLIGTTSAVITGGVVLSMLPEFTAIGLTKYVSSAISGATFRNFVVKYPKAAVFALAIPITLKMTTGLPAVAVIVYIVFGTLFIARVLYKKGSVK